VVSSAVTRLRQERRPYTAMLEGRTTGNDITYTSRGSLGNSGPQTEARMESPQSKAEGHAVGAANGSKINFWHDLWC